MKSVRSLEMLHKHGSTSRVLNLLRVYEQHGTSSDYQQKPMFLTPKLNRAIIVKHKLRRDEDYLMQTKKKVVTKVIFPLVADALSFGGHSFFVGQTNFARVFYEALGGETEEARRDLEVLSYLDNIPSLDPFLVREYLRRHNVFADDCYFDLAPVDLEAIKNFAADEVRRLVSIAFGGGDESNQKELVDKMVKLILSNEADDRLQPMRVALGLTGNDFKEGVFAWRGFLYFKWQLSTCLDSLAEIIRTFDSVQLVNCTSFDTKRNVKALTQQIKIDLVKVIKLCEATVNLYDRAFSDLVDRAKAQAFREFLLAGPDLFIDLGRMMGGINHIVTFWNYRFPQGKRKQADANDYEALLLDFTSCLSMQAV